MILARYISPSEYGFLSLFNTVVMVLSYFKAMSTEGYISVSYFQEGNDGIKNTISGVCLLSGAFSIMLLIVYMSCGSKISELLSLPRPILLYAIIIALCTLYVNLNLDYLRIKERVRIYGIFSCTNAALNFVLSILFVKSLALGWEGRIYAQLISYLLFAVIGVIIFIKNGYIGFPKLSYLKTMLIWGIPLIPHLATQFLRQGCDTYIIKYYHTMTDVGLFNFAFTLVSIITMIGVGFNQSNSVDIYKVLGDNALSNQKKLSLINKQTKSIFIIYCIATVLCVVLCSVIIPIVLPKYIPSLPYFIIMSGYGLCVCVYLLYTNFLFYYHKTRRIMYITFGSACIHLILSMVFTRVSLYLTCVVYIVSQLFVALTIRKLALQELHDNLKFE